MMISAAVPGGVLEGFKVSNTTFSHLLFVNDTLIFCNAMLGQLCSVFLLFESASGLKVNLAKSVLIPVGNVDQVGMLAGILGCRVASLHVKYLGLPLGASYKAKHIWDGVIEKLEYQLTSWKMLYLLKVGRVTLINRPWLICPHIICLSFLSQ